jgi:hypothetical protein
VYERHERLPLSYEVDVLVVGGGPAGFAAAVGAGRLGLSVLLVEQFNCLGGIATAGGHNHICLYSAWGTAQRVVGGIPFEMARRVADSGYGICDRSAADFEIEGMKLVLEQMAQEAGVQLLYHTFFSDAIVEGRRVAGAIVQNKGGRQVIAAKQVIDCSGDGDVAARAGCRFDIGDEESGLCQPVTLMFTIGGVDYERVQEFRGDDFELAHVWKDAQERGDMRPFQSVIMGWWWTPTRPDQLGINFTHVTAVDGTKAEDLTRATLEARQQAYETIEVYRKYVPGMEHCYMISTPNTIGVRESRRIRGDYTLTLEDLMARREFADSIGYGSFFVDIHNVSGPGMDAKTLRPEKGFKYQIPYRILLPGGMDNLLVAGRCVSCTHEALGSLRVMPQCGVMGQVAGVAAALSLQEGTDPREISIRRLQAQLREQDCILDAADVNRANDL